MRSSLIDKYCDKYCDKYASMVESEKTCPEKQEIPDSNPG